MKEKKLYSDRRWTDPPKAFVIGHEELTEEEKKEAEEAMKKFIKKHEQALNKKLNNSSN